MRAVPAGVWLWYQPDDRSVPVNLDLAGAYHLAVLWQLPLIDAAVGIWCDQALLGQAKDRPYLNPFASHHEPRTFAA